MNQSNVYIYLASTGFPESSNTKAWDLVRTAEDEGLFSVDKYDAAIVDQFGSSRVLDICLYNKQDKLPRKVYNLTVSKDLRELPTKVSTETIEKASKNIQLFHAFDDHPDVDDDPLMACRLMASSPWSFQMTVYEAMKVDIAVEVIFTQYFSKFREEYTRGVFPSDFSNSPYIYISPRSPRYRGSTLYYQNVLGGITFFEEEIARASTRYMSNYPTILGDKIYRFKNPKYWGNKLKNINKDKIDVESASVEDDGSITDKLNYLISEIAKISKSKVYHEGYHWIPVKGMYVTIGDDKDPWIIVNYDHSARKFYIEREVVMGDSVQILQRTVPVRSVKPFRITSYD